MSTDKIPQAPAKEKPQSDPSDARKPWEVVEDLRAWLPALQGYIDLKDRYSHDVERAVEKAIGKPLFGEGGLLDADERAKEGRFRFDMVLTTAEEALVHDFMEYVLELEAWANAEFDRTHGKAA